MMTHRERVQTTLNHRQPDKVAVDFGGINDSTMHVSCIEGLREYYGLEKRPVTVVDVYIMAGMIEEDLADVMGVDTASAFPKGTMFGFPRDKVKEWINPDGQTILVPEGFNPQPDGKGGYYIHPQGDLSIPASGHMPAKSVYFDAIIRQEPFDDDDLDPQDNLEEWTLLDDDNLQYIKEQAEAGCRQNRSVILAAPGMGLGDAADIPGVGLKHPKGIRNYTDWYMSPLLREDFVKELFDRQMDIAIENLRRVNEVCGDMIDVAFTCAADLSHQHSLFVSPDVFREVYMPYYKKANNWIHENTNWKILKHNCGAVRPLIPLLIEAGFDALNPVQTSADGMDPQELKNEFGKDITFWGGGVDTQKVLPFGTPEEVREQVLRRCEIFAKDGGFVFNAVHIIQANTPVENIVAMLDAVKEFNGEK
ncbi:methyltransferase [Lawsonibacter sp. OA9]|uniref:uroporphyrinogen decarboxylase family protein n=1 Tax=Oscillospiraceae TaxID=216572 RepID=UPI001F06C4CA|nr:MULTISPECIES: uroporphyrinogen decarboxylase family protein [Oscillospiraceae]MCH1980910.1 methyltransferase [Lawsonibacter sp. OA9]MCH1981507.1 methyltransferase [Ruminococcus sp. OA3]